MLFKPDLKPNLDEMAKADGKRAPAARARHRVIPVVIVLLVLGGLGYVGWTSFQQK